MVDNLIYEIPLDLINKLSGLFIILKALGWVIIIYVVFSIVNMVINRKRNNEIKKINKTLFDIKKLLSKQNKK
jgi:hypothetical protein